MNAQPGTTGVGERGRHLSTRAKVLLVVAALLSSLLALPALPFADAQPVGNPGPANLTIVGGAVRLGGQFMPLTPKEFPECSDGENNDGDPTNPADAQDLLIDYPADPQCTSPEDNSEAMAGFQPKLDTTISGNVAANGTLTVPQSGIFFPPLYQYAQGGVLTVQVQPQSAGTGSLNPMTGAATMNITLRLSITGTAGGFDLGASCGIGPFTINATTGTTSPPVGFEPMTGVPYDPNDGTATLVGNTFSVPGASSCGPLNAANGPLSGAFGVPAPAGVNFAQLEVVGNPIITKGVNAVNVPSTVEGDAPLTVNFNGTASTAVRPITSYEWDFGNGETATGPTAFTTYTTPGTYQAKLTVTDADGDQDVSIQTIQVNVPPNIPPNAAIGSSGTGGQAPYVVTFNGSGSNDPDGSIVSYEWDFGNDRTATGPTPAAVTYTSPGTYTATLTVTDNQGATGVATREIIVTGAPNASPNAVINIVSAAGTIPLTVNLSGANSSDPDGSIVSYEWDLGNGETATGPSVQAIYEEAGDYLVTLTVTDNQGATAVQTTTINVSEDPNLSPTAEFDADPISGSAPLAVTFDGSASSDVDGTIAGYAWNFGNGQNGSGPTPPAVTYALPGTYTATLTVTDNRGATGTAVRTITVSPPPNQSPVPNVSAAPSSGNAPLLVQLSSAGSSDADGAITGYSWNFGNGNSSTSPNPQAVYNSPGVYTVSLTVTDNQGATAIQSTTVTVSPANQPPVPHIVATPLSGSAPLNVSVNGGGSIDPDGSIVSYSWTFGNGETATGALASTTYTSPGSYLIRLTVVDNRGTSRNITTTVVVGGINVQPIAVLSALPTSGPAPLLVQLGSAGSNDPDGSIISRTWDFGNGQTASGAATQVTYTVPGTYVVTLSVTDNRGAVGTATETIVVDPPIAPADRIRLQLSGGATYNFDGRLSAGNIRVTRDVFGIVSVKSTGAQYVGPGGSTASVSVSLDRFLFFNAYSGTMTVNDPANGVSNLQIPMLLAPLSSPSSTSARAAGRATVNNKSYTYSYTFDDRVA